MAQLMATKKTDAEIQQHVLRELKWDTRVEETEIGVEVDNGVITLTGTVSHWGKRFAAAEAAHRVRGVLDVANDITVRVAGTPGRTDTEIARAVRHALEWDVFVPDTRIQSTVSDGAVALRGDVHNWSQWQDAERAVRNLSGVRVVMNRIEVKAPKVDAAKLRKTIEEALERRAQREANQVRFEVHDGHVKVFGEIPTWAEKEAVIAAAKGTPGVSSVDDKLAIMPS